MAEIPNDVMRNALDKAMAIVGRMCVTMDHSFGLQSEQDQRGLLISMKQLAQHDISPAIARAIMEERNRCAKIADSHPNAHHTAIRDAIMSGGI